MFSTPSLIDVMDDIDKESVKIDDTLSQQDTVDNEVKSEGKSDLSLMRTTTMRRISSKSTNISNGSSTKSSSDSNRDPRKSASGRDLYALDELVSSCPISDSPMLKHAALAAGGVAGDGEGTQKPDQIRPFFDMRDYENVPDSYGESTTFELDVLKCLMFTKIS